MRTRLTLSLIVAAACAVMVGIAAFETGVLGGLEGESVDLRFKLRGAQRPVDVAVVAVDEKTFSELGAQWPFRRSLHARLIDELHRDGARAIVYDVQFTEATDRADDLALYDAAGRARPVVLATTEVDGRGHTNVLGGEQNLRPIGAVAAASNLPTDSGGVIRHYPYSLLGLPSLAVAGARDHGTVVRRSSFGDGRAWIDFRGPPGTISTYSFSDVLRGRVDPSRLAGRVVVIGAAAPTLQDVHRTSTTSAVLMSGPEIQANAIWTALHGNPLRSAPAWIALLAIVLAGLLAPLAALRLRPLRGGLVAVLAAAGYLVAAQLAFGSGRILSIVTPMLALIVGIVGMIAASYAIAYLERNLFSRRLRESQLELIERLAQAVEHRDAETGAHVRRIGILTERLALALGWSERDADMLGHASAMHDVGKIGIPDTILLKAGKLDEQEWEVVKSHTTLGGEILADSANPLVRMAERIARSHHERWDGFGYPDGLAGEEIPLEARICSVCDVFDALLSGRSYKEAWQAADALTEIRRCSGTQFDPSIVERFLEVVPDLLAELVATEAPSVPAFAQSPEPRLA